MDRGMLQRQKALEVKRILRNNTSRKHLRRSLDTTEFTRLQSDAALDGEISLRNFLESKSNNETGAVIGVMPQNNLNHVDIVTDLTAFNMAMWDETFYNGFGFGEAIFDQERSILIPNQEPLDGSTTTGNLDDEPNYTSSGPLEYEEALRRNNQLETSFDSLFSSSQPYSKVSTYDGDFAEDHAPKSQYMPLPLVQISAVPHLAYHGRHNSLSSGSTTPVVGGDTEDTLFMHYLDEVFHIQYPFYHCSKEGRGWLFSILRRDESAYYATLALSGYHRHSTLSSHKNCTSNPVLLQTANKHYDLALQGMQLSLGQSSTWSGTTVLDRSVEILVSILQLLYWEVRSTMSSVVFNANTFMLKLFHGGTENWRIHLRAANTLIPALVGQVQKSTMIQRTIHSGSRHEQHHETLLHSEYDSAIRFLLSSFLSMDIVSCASTRSSLSLELDHKLMLERDGICLENLNGCKKWVLVLILEISQLDTWKKLADKTQKLSIVDLVKRGGQIEKRLREELANIETSASTTAFLDNSSEMVTSTEITKIFALSAITYLHVVTSGAHPELPEVQRSVSDTIAAFQHLTDTKLLRNLMWPFCVTGSLALEGKHAFFRNLISTADAAKTDFGTCLEAFKIIEECWNMRKTGSNNCDWSSAMNNCGCFVLFA